MTRYRTSHPLYVPPVVRGALVSLIMVFAGVALFLIVRLLGHLS